MLAAGFSTHKITQEAQIHRNTIGNWRRTNPAFAQALADAQYDRVLFWRDSAEEHAPLAIFTICEILNNPKAPAAVRLRAALAMLQHATTLPPPAPAEQPVAPAEDPANTTAAQAEETAANRTSPIPDAPVPTKPTPLVVHPGKLHNLHNVAQMPAARSQGKGSQALS
jgi:hypothetical protein